MKEVSKMDFFGIVEAFAMVVLLLYIIVLTFDVIYDAIYARRHKAGQKG